MVKKGKENPPKESFRKKFAAVRKAFTKAAKHVHDTKGFSAKNLKDIPIAELTAETKKVLQDAVDISITHEVPKVMRDALSKDVFVFSGMKTYTQLKETSELLLDKKGNIKPFSRFQQDVLKIDEKYNQNYLEAEYQFATSSSQMAAKWQELEKDGDRYDLQYRTASDDKVRDSHRALHNVTLPSNDPFWNNYYPPNGWRCRCTTVQVRKGKYNVSDSDTAIKEAEKATTEIGKDGKNNLVIFRYNPGKQKVIFPPNHPYTYKSKNDSDKSKAIKIITDEAV